MKTIFLLFMIAITYYVSAQPRVNTYQLCESMRILEHTRPIKFEFPDGSSKSFDTLDFLATGGETFEISFNGRIDPAVTSCIFKSHVSYKIYTHYDWVVKYDEPIYDSDNNSRVADISVAEYWSPPMNSGTCGYRIILYATHEALTTNCPQPHEFTLAKGSVFTIRRL